jgi:rubrerythrin
MRVGGRISMQMEAGRYEGPAVLGAGRRAEGEFRCAECGYGVIVRKELPQCPMCRGLLWEVPTDSPFASRTS